MVDSSWLSGLGHPQSRRQPGSSAVQRGLQNAQHRSIPEVRGVAPSISPVERDDPRSWSLTWLDMAWHGLGWRLNYAELDCRHSPKMSQIHSHATAMGQKKLCYQPKQRCFKPLSAIYRLSSATSSPSYCKLSEVSVSYVFFFKGVTLEFVCKVMQNQGHAVDAGNPLPPPMPSLESVKVKSETSQPTAVDDFWIKIRYFQYPLSSFGLSQLFTHSMSIEPTPAQEFEVEAPISQGQMLILDNWRVLHGRSGGKSSPNRVIMGGTVVREGFHSKAVQLMGGFYPPEQKWSTIHEGWGSPSWTKNPGRSWELKELKELKLGLCRNIWK